MLALDNRRRLLTLPMTPLIDVVFILLLFFMLSSTFIRHQQITFDTAASGNSANTQTPPTSISLIVLPDGLLQTSGQTFATSDVRFSDLVKEWVELGKPVIVTARKDTPVQTLIRSLDSLRSAGLLTLSLSESI